MIPDYGCNAVYFSEWLKKDYPDIFIGLARILNKHNIAYDVIPNTKDVWCRDYMPLQLDKERYLCYEYKPDYLIKIASNRKYSHSAPRPISLTISPVFPSARYLIKIPLQVLRVQIPLSYHTFPAGQGRSAALPSLPGACIMG